MPKLQVAYKEVAPKVALVQNDGTAAPSGYVIAGSFDHPDPVYPGSLVLYQGVRDALYHFDQLNMTEVDIELADGVVAAYVTSIEVPVAAHRDIRLNDPIEEGMRRLNARVWPPNAADPSLTYESSDTSVVEVSADGVLTAKKAGNAVITITAPGSAGTSKLKRAVKVTVSGVANEAIVAVTGVTVSPTTSSKAVGQTQQLTPTVAPANASNKAVTYTSGTPAVATVNAAGLVTAVAEGTATITVKTADGNKTATHTITVTPAG